MHECQKLTSTSREPMAVKSSREPQASHLLVAAIHVVVIVPHGRRQLRECLVLRSSQRLTGSNLDNYPDEVIDTAGSS